MPILSSAMIRWPVVPLAFGLLGLTIGLLALVAVLELDMTGRARNRALLIPLATSAAICEYLMTMRLLRFEQHRSITVRDHPRQMCLVYPLWLLTAAGLGRRHVAILYIVPFAALSGVMVGNFVAIARCARAVA